MSTRQANSAQPRKVLPTYNMHELSNNIFNSESYSHVKIDHKRELQVRNKNFTGDEFRPSRGIKKVPLPKEYTVEAPRMNNFENVPIMQDVSINKVLDVAPLQRMGTEPIKNVVASNLNSVNINNSSQVVIPNSEFKNIQAVGRKAANNSNNSNNYAKLQLPPKIPKHNQDNNRYDKPNYFPLKNNSLEINQSPSNNNLNINTVPLTTNNANPKPITYMSTENVRPLDAKMVEKLYSRNYSASNLIDRQKLEEIKHQNQQPHDGLFFYKNHNLYREKLLLNLEKQKKFQNIYIDQVLKTHEKKNEEIIEIIKKEVNDRDERDKENISKMVKQKEEMKNLHGKILEYQMDEKKQRQEDNKLRKMISKENLNSLVNNIFLII